MGRTILSCLSLGLAAAATTGGVAGLVGLSSPEAVAAASALGGVAGNFATDLCKILSRPVAERMLEGRSGIDQNYRVPRALRLAQLHALEVVLDHFDTTWAGTVEIFRVQDAARFSAALRKFLADETEAVKKAGFEAAVSLAADERLLRDAVLAELPDLFDEALAARRGAGDVTALLESLQQLRGIAERAVLAEIRLRTARLDADFPSAFIWAFDGTGFAEAWFDLFVRNAAFRLTKSADFRDIWNAEQDALVKAIVTAHSDVLRAIKANTAALLAGQDAMAQANAQRHREVLDAIARDKGVDPKLLVPLFEHLGQSGLSLDEVRTRAGEAIEAMLVRARQKVEPSNEGADIDATIGAARARLGRLDMAGARVILATKIAEEEEARRQRLIPLLEEQAAVERLAYDHEAAKVTLRLLLTLDKDRIWTWIELGDLHVTTGALRHAMDAFCQAMAIAARLAESDSGNAGWQRDLSVSQDRIGNVQREQGDLAAALGRYQASLAIAARLAESDSGNAGWQRDLSVSQERIGDVQREQGGLAAALGSYQASLAIRLRLAESDSGNAGWQRDLALSYGRVAVIRQLQGRPGDALPGFRQGRDLIVELKRRSPDNATLPRDLAWFEHHIGICAQ